MQITQEIKLGEIAAAEPESIRVFESPGIDCCCGGKRVSMEDVINRISEAERDAHAPAPQAWVHASLGIFIDHIVVRHHAYIGLKECG